MWNTEKQQQLDGLRRREHENSLTDEERQALDQLSSELEQQEWSELHPALERAHQEQKRLQEEFSRLRTENVILAALAERYEELLARARVQLDGLFSEHQVLKNEYERVIGQPLIASPS